MLVKMYYHPTLSHVSLVAVGVISFHFFESLSFYTVYATLLGLGQLGMICAVFTVHLKSRGASNPETAPRAPNRRQTLTATVQTPTY